MINATSTVRIKSVNQTHDQEGSLIAFGIAEFYYRSREGVVADKVPYRSLGVPAVVINEQGSGIYGTAEGYLDLQIDNRGEYKEKITTFVIKNFVTAQPINELTQTSSNSPKPETPEFAKELVEENITSTNEDVPF
ncbi:hypothetical protein SD80_011250 [Scytonema tolypothrichoides VB-61278]|nr:hypothetical protein SD80_011250 [Scytonema tolypothrichoides VB-61278]